MKQNHQLQRKNQYGFTMVEMLAVLVILAVLSLIVIPSISSVIRKSSQQYYQTLEGNIKIAGTDYFSDNWEEKPKYNLSTSDVSIAILEEKQYLKEKVVDAKGNDTCSGYVRVLKEKEGEYEYTTCLVCSDYQSSSSYCDRDYDPDNNENIYTLKAPQTVYSYIGKPLDVNRLEKATLYARDKKIGTVMALASSVENIDNSVETVYPKQVQYEVEVEGKPLTAVSDLQIYQNDAPVATFVNNTVGTPVYISNTWTNQTVQEKITVSPYVHGTFKELQYYDRTTGKWKTLSTKQTYDMEFTCSSNKTCITEQLIRSIDQEGNVSKSRNSIIKIDKIKPACPLSVVEGSKGDNNFYVSPVAVKLDTDDQDSGINETTIGITDNVDQDKVNSDIYTTKTDGTHTFDGFVVDNAGNSNTCSLGTIQIDTTPPTINSFTIKSKDNYASLSTELSISAEDSNGLGQMYLSQTGYEQNGTWETFSTTKSYQLSGKLDGTSRTIYLSLKDKAGNIAKKEINYTVYKECSQTTTSWGNFGACSKECGTGSQSRSGTKYDNYTNTNCGSDSESKHCNTRTCCSSTKVGSYGSWGSCSASCGGGKQYRTAYLVSTYDGSSCGSREESQSCNTQVCPHTHKYGNSLNSTSGTYLNYKVTTYHWNGTWKCTSGHTHTAKTTLRAYKQQCIICGAEGEYYWCPCPLDKQSGCP